MTNRTGLFYEEFTLTGNFSDNSIQFPSQHNHLKIAVNVSGGALCEFDLTGAPENAEGKLLSGESQNFSSLAFDKIAVRGSGTVRIWAWHQT